MTESEWHEIMEEPPSGFNHGRDRGGSPAWRTLESEGYDEPSLKHYPPNRWSEDRPIVHGTPTAYTWRKCRCDECKDWKRRNNAKYNTRRPSTRAGRVEGNRNSDGANP